MRFRLFTLSVLFFGVASAAAAQTARATHVPLPPTVVDTRVVELRTWLAEYKQWEAWTRRWGNRIAYNAAGGVIKKRSIRPEPPAWLRDECEQLLDSDGALGEACAILARWDSLYDGLISGRSAGSAPPSDVPVKSSLLRRVHLTGGWVPAQLPAPKVYLVAGMQVGIVEVGRATLPAVGVGLIAMADGSGGYEWKPATVIGVGYRLTSFAFPGIKRHSHLHINVARVTIHGSRTIPVGIDPSQNLIGFSLTFNKAR